MPKLMSPRIPLVAVLGAALLAGCTMAPKYERPDSPTTANWPSGPAYHKESAADRETVIADIGWSDYFSDPKLEKVISLALENNRDLRVSSLNIEKALSTYDVQRASLMPWITGNASGLGQQQPSTATGGGDNTISRSYGVTGGISGWELDFFGRLQSLSQQAFQSYLATEEAYRAAYLALVAETANAYLTLAADRERLALAQSTFSSQQQAYDLTSRAVELGTANALALAQARVSVETARADISLYTRAVAQDENALTLLVGTSIPKDLIATPALVSVTRRDRIPAGTPSSVLLRRPDIVSAEDSLKGYNANIGAARAAFFPTITLTTNAGTASSALSGLFTGGSGAWLFNPAVSLPIFEGGQLIASLKISETDKKIATASYEKAIQTGFREVADALATRGTIDAQLAAQSALVKANQESYNLSSARFRDGVDSYLAVLDSQQNLYSSQLQLIDVRLQRLANMVVLYKVLGGGWTEKTVPPKPVEPQAADTKTAPAQTAAAEPARPPAAPLRP